MKNQKNLFVSYKLAKLAKKNKFNETCLGWFGKRKKNDKPSRFNLEQGCYNSLKDNGGKIDAPLHQQLVDWFAKEHNIDIQINFIKRYHGKSPNNWRFILEGINFNLEGEAGCVYGKYENSKLDATIKSLEEAFKLI